MPLYKMRTIEEIRLRKACGYVTKKLVLDCGHEAYPKWHELSGRPIGMKSYIGGKARCYQCVGGVDA